MLCGKGSSPRGECSSFSQALACTALVYIIINWYLFVYLILNLIPHGVFHYCIMYYYYSMVLLHYALCVELLQSVQLVEWFLKHLLFLVIIYFPSVQLVEFSSKHLFVWLIIICRIYVDCYSIGILYCLMDKCLHIA